MGVRDGRNRVEIRDVIKLAPTARNILVVIILIVWISPNVSKNGIQIMKIMKL